MEKKAIAEIARTDPKLLASHEQYQQIREARLEIQLKKVCAEIKADNEQELSKKLLDYVSADGRYTPITQSVDIYLPLESLRDIRIIDTPGINDPVRSREQRTNEFLAKCDVVFIVSPAGQFLDQVDLDLMGRIGEKEGIQELVMIASQVDNQMFGSDTHKPTLEDALEHITRTLGRHMTNTLEDFKKAHPEVGKLYDSLIEEGGARIVYTSGICHGMSLRYDDQKSWDSGERKVWENLNEDYHTDFPANDSERCRTSLALLGNIGALKKTLEHVRQKKDHIIEERTQNLVEAKRKAIDKCKDEMLKALGERLRRVHSTNIDDLNRQIRVRGSKMEVAGAEINSEFRKELSAYRKELKKTLHCILDEAYEVTENAQKKFIEKRTEKRERQVGGLLPWVADKFWDGGKEKYTVEVTSVYPQPLIASLRKFARELGQDLAEKAEQQSWTFNDNLRKNMAKVAPEALNGEIDASVIIHSVNSIVNKIDTPRFKLDDTQVRKLQEISAQKLEEVEAVDFSEKVENTALELEDQAGEQISNFINDLFENRLPKSIADDFFVEIKEEIDRLRKDVEDGKSVVDKLNQAQKALNAL